MDKAFDLNSQKSPPQTLKMTQGEGRRCQSKPRGAIAVCKSTANADMKILRTLGKQNNCNDGSITLQASLVCLCGLQKTENQFPNVQILSPPVSPNVLNGPQWLYSRKMDPPGLSSNGQISAYEQEHIHTYYTLSTCSDAYISTFPNSLHFDHYVL